MVRMFLISLPSQKMMELGKKEVINKKEGQDAENSSAPPLVQANERYKNQTNENIILNSLC